MSPVTTVGGTFMPQTNIFGASSGVSANTPYVGFPPTVAQLSFGISSYRAMKGYEPLRSYPFSAMGRALVGTEFEAAGRRMRIADAKFHPVAMPIENPGSVEMNAALIVGPIAAAVAAFPTLGLGGPDKQAAKENKARGDGAATMAMKAHFNRTWMDGRVLGGEGGGRDKMGREAALYMGEYVGTGGGPKIGFYVDPLEVTNATKILNRDAAFGKVGEGWSDELLDPANWFAGYSGASSLMLAVNLADGKSRMLSDDLYLNKMQVQHRAARHFAATGVTLASRPEFFIEQISEALNVPKSELKAAGLARSRHMNTMNRWIAAGMSPWNIFTPSDGDAVFPSAIAAGALHFAGLTGGVMEGLMSTASGIPMGIRTSMQFVSHHMLGEQASDTDLANEAHRFGFSESEYHKMFGTRLYDSGKIAPTVRFAMQDTALRQHILNYAFSDRFSDHVPDFKHETFLAELEQVADKGHGDEAFSKSSIEFVKNALGVRGFLDVRGIYKFRDFVRSRDWLYAASALTPNRWAPLLGIREAGGRQIVDTLVVGGSNVVYILEAAVEPLG